jgi:hypothetical protein
VWKLRLKVFIQNGVNSASRLYNIHYFVIALLCIIQTQRWVFFPMFCACYRSVQSLLSSRLLSRNVKVKIYKTMFRAVFWVILPCKMIVIRDEWWWRQYAPLKRRSTIILHGSITQKTALNIILAAMRTWNHTYMKQVCSHESTWGLSHTDILCKLQCASKFNQFNFLRESFLPMLQQLLDETWMKRTFIPTSAVMLANLHLVHMTWVLLSTSSMLWWLCFSFTVSNS